MITNVCANIDIVAEDEGPELSGGVAKAPPRKKDGA